MLVSNIAAMDRRGLIGDEAGMPWHLPADLRRFRAYTWGKPIIMGRKTFELIGKPLPGRFSIVLTRNADYTAPGCRVARTFEEALSIAGDYLRGAGGDEAMIIGGGAVYREAIHRWDRCYLTVVEGEFQGDTSFPLRALLQQSWRPTCSPEIHLPDEKNPHQHSFHIIERVQDAVPRLPVEEPLPDGGPAGAVEGLDLAALLARGTVAD
jgi:dihydrofolate reductase